MSSSTETRMFAYFVPEKNLVVDERERERKKGKKGEEKNARCVLYLEYIYSAWRVLS